MKLHEFIEAYLKDSAVISVCDNEYIYYKGTVENFESDHNFYYGDYDVLMDRKVINIEGIGDSNDIIIIIED